LAPAARDVEKLQGPASETGAETFAVDASDPSAVAKLFLDTERLLAEPDVVIYNASSRVSGKPTDLDSDAIAQTYIDVLSQPRSAWSFDVDLRPWTEPF